MMDIKSATRLSNSIASGAEVLFIGLLVVAFALASGFGQILIGIFVAMALVRYYLSQVVRAFGLRRIRYWGLAKTRLQHIATSAAMNIE